MKSSTCMDGGLLVFGGLERNGSCLFACAARPRAIPRPRIGATVNRIVRCAMRLKVYVKSKDPDHMYLYSLINKFYNNR